MPFLDNKKVYEDKIISKSKMKNEKKSFKYKKNKNNLIISKINKKMNFISIIYSQDILIYNIIHEYYRN